MTETLPTATTENGRQVVVCYCGGGDAHEWRPHGGGMRILACPTDWPTPEFPPRTRRAHPFGSRRLAAVRPRSAR